MSTGSLWPYFWKGQLQNSSQYFSYCKGCVENRRQNLHTLDPTYDDDDFVARGQTFVDACQYVGSTRGDKKAWIPHILGGKGIAACAYASPAAIAEATRTTRT
ncbi:hypothetical protein B0H11DRAFT_622035 [Mycena galericulata]|nr:hypothetical protein B0H11DRAFT_622035 [Mycena galericulata]